MASPGSALRVTSCPHEFFKSVGTYIGCQQTFISISHVSGELYIHPAILVRFLTDIWELFSWRAEHLLTSPRHVSYCFFLESFCQSAVLSPSNSWKHFSLLLCLKNVHSPCNSYHNTLILRRKFAGELYPSPAILITFLQYFGESLLECSTWTQQSSGLTYCGDIEESRR